MIKEMKKTRVMEEEFKCAICLSMFEMPVSIPCGHTFCFSCLAQLYDKNKEECPLCKAHHDIWNFNPQRMKVNTLIQNTMEHLFPDRPKSISALAMEYNRIIKSEEYDTGKKIIELAENIRPFFKYFGFVDQDILVDKKEYTVRKLRLTKESSELYPVMTFKHIPMIDIDYKFDGSKFIGCNELMERPIMKTLLSSRPNIVYKSGKNSKHIFLLDWYIDWEKKETLINQFQQLLDLGCDAKFLLYTAVNQGFNVRLGSKITPVNIENDNWTLLDSYYEKESEYLGKNPTKKVLHNRDLVLKHETIHEVYRTVFKLKEDGANYFPHNVIKEELKNYLTKFEIH